DAEVAAPYKTRSTFIRRPGEIAWAELRSDDLDEDLSRPYRSAHQVAFSDPSELDVGPGKDREAFHSMNLLQRISDGAQGKTWRETYEFGTRTSSYETEDLPGEHGAPIRRVRSFVPSPTG